MIRGKAAALTVDFVEKKRLDANQMRVLEGIEQREFIEMFQGGIVIQRELKKDVKKEFGGGNINVKSITKGNGFNQQNKLNGCNDSKTMNRKIGFNQNTSNTTKQMEKKDSNEPYQIYEIRQQRGTENIRMLQISVEDEVDINRSYFILTNQSDDINQSKGILILGKHSIPLSTIQETLKRCQLISNENLQTIPIDEFLTSFDINNQFNQFTTIKTIPLPQYPHAFKISASTGQIEYEMIYELHIQTLQDNRIVVTIVNSDLFFWVKEDVRLDEIVKLLKTMTDYVECSKIRNVELSPFFIRPLSEPRNFLSVFFGNCELPITNEKSENIFDIFALLTKSYSLIELQRKPKLLVTISNGQLELFLDDNEFKSIFGVDKEGFSKLPQWKQKSAKQKVGLWLGSRIPHRNEG